MFNETSISNLEASLGLISTASFFEDLPDQIKTALQLYDCFKSQMFKMGHTFLLRKDLQMHHYYYKKDYKKQHSTMAVFDVRAIDFLVLHGVLKQEMGKDHNERLHLMRYWKAEESILFSFQTT